MEQTKVVARKRAGSENGVAEGPSTEESMRRTRRVLKSGAQSYHNRLTYIRWGLVIVVLVLVAVGLYYYYFNTVSGEKKETQAGRRGGGEGRENKAGERTVKDTNQKKKKTAAKSKPAKSENVSKKKSSGGDKKKAASNKGEKSSKPNTKRDIPTYDVKDVRLLRRPILAGDADRPYIIEILNGDNLLIDERYSEALEKFNEILKMFPQSPRGLFGKGEALVGLAEQKSSNKLLETAIEFYQDTASASIATDDLKMGALARLADLYQRRGKHAAAVSALEKLYHLDDNDTVVANRLGAAYVKTGHTEKAENHFKSLLNDTPDNGYAKAHLGYLQYKERRYEEALPLLMEGLRKDKSVQRNGRFYLYAGECLVRLNRSDEAQVLYSEAVSRDLFPSLYQRSLFNEPHLRAKPWWTLGETGYQTQLQPLLDSIENITSEVIPALLGDSQAPPTVFPVYSYGKKHAENCRKVPFTCSLLESVPEATACKHGEVKFLVVPPKTHVPPHTGQTNTRLSVLMGLNFGESQLRVRLAEETRVLGEGDVLVFDDSFEQELWYSSLRPGLVLSVDVWHPDLTPDRRRRLTRIQ